MTEDHRVYEHTQSSHVGFGAVVGLVVLLFVTMVATGGTETAVLLMVLAFLVFIGVIALGASRLTTTVTRDEVMVEFRWGWPRRVIDRTHIVQHSRVRNSWIYGWGLRWIPGGMLWNVWGLDAVELQLDGGRRFRIGTDDPTGLDAALTRR